MSGIGDAEEPWSEDDLFDLDSTLSFGARIEEIAVFLRREVEDVERKAFERNRPNSAKLGLTAPNRPNSLRVDFEKRPAASSEERTNGREKSNPLSPSGTQPPSPRRSDLGSDYRGNVQQIGSRSRDY